MPFDPATTPILNPSAAARLVKAAWVLPADPRIEAPAGVRVGTAFNRRTSEIPLEFDDAAVALDVPPTKGDETEATVLAYSRTRDNCFSLLKGSSAVGLPLALDILVARAESDQTFAWTRPQSVPEQFALRLQFFALYPPEAASGSDTKGLPWQWDRLDTWVARVGVRERFDLRTSSNMSLSTKPVVLAVTATQIASAPLPRGVTLTIAIAASVY